MISRAGSFRSGFFRAKHSLGWGFFSMRDILPCGIFSCAGFLPCSAFFERGFFRAGFSSATRTGAIAGRVSACSGSRPLSRPLIPVPHSCPSFLSPHSCPRFLSPGPAGRAPRRAFPCWSACRSACRWTPPGAFFRVLRACGCPRRTVVPRSVFDSLLKSPGPVLGIPPNFSYLWMQKMSFAALKTYRTE